MQKKFFLILFYLNFCYGGLSIHPVVSSFLLPGSGERNLGYNESSMFFMQSEILLFTSCLLTFKASDLLKDKYMAYAGEHALTTLPTDDRYWVDIGNYNTNNDFDYEHLRMRDSKEGQWSNHPWDWRFDNVKRKKFENMRIKSDKYFLAGKFLIGGIVMNHIISSVNTLYILRLNEDKSLFIKPSIQKLNGSYKYSLLIQF